jgi:hypothetical protein
MGQDNGEMDEARHDTSMTYAISPNLWQSVKSVIPSSLVVNLSETCSITYFADN